MSSTTDLIAFITDTHVGARNSSKVFRELFRSYYKDVFFPYIKKTGIKKIYHGGDFFDNRNSITLSDIDFIVNEFIPWLEDSGATMYINSGNHDVAYKNTNRINSLAIMKHSKNVVVVDDDILVDNVGDTNIVICPWINRENEERLLTELKKYANEDHILLGHFEIEGAKMYKNSKVCEHGIKTSDLKGFKKVLSGHFHHRSEIGNITYLGALFHYNWQDYNDWRGFTTYSPSEDKWDTVENPYCIFTQLDFHGDDLINMSKDDLRDSTEGQIVRIVIDRPYERVDLKEVTHKIESFNPIALDVIDNTIISDENDPIDEDIDADKKVKSIDDYFCEYVNNDNDLIEAYEEVKEKAKNIMVEFA